MTRILITGAGGFIGEPTVRALRAALSSAEIHGTTRSNRSGFDIQWHQVDLLRDGAACIESIRPDVLIHLAWETTHNEFWTSPLNAEWERASMEILDAFASCGGRRAVISGTCAEYGWDEAEGPFREDQSLIEPASEYGRAKNQLHVDARSLLADSSTSLAWARIFFPYGPGEGAGKLVTSIASALVRGEPATIRAGALVRDFIYSEDAGAAIAHLARDDFDGAVNIGSGSAVSLRTVGNTIENAAGLSGQLVIEDGAGGPAVVADTTRLARQIGFSTLTPLDRGIASVVEGLRAQLH